MWILIGWIESFDCSYTFETTFGTTYLDNGLPVDLSSKLNPSWRFDSSDLGPSLKWLVCFAITSQAFIFLATWSLMGPTGLVKGFYLSALCLTPCHFGVWMGCFQPHPLLLYLGLNYLCFLCMPPLPMDSLICGLGALSFVGLPFFTSGGFCFARLSFASCTFSFNLLSLAAWAATSFIGVPMIARGSFPIIALSSFALVGFSWFWIPLFRYGVPFSLFRVPLCALACTCLDGVHLKDASNDVLGFGGDFMES